MSLSVISQGPQPTPRPIVVVLDEARTRSIDLDNDGIPDLAHGEVIQKMISNWRPDLDVRLLEAHQSPRQAIRSLKQVQAWQRQGLPIRVINVSFSPTALTLPQLAKLTGLALHSRSSSEIREKWITQMTRAAQAKPTVMATLKALQKQLGECYQSERLSFEELEKATSGLQRKLANLRHKKAMICDLQPICNALQRLIKQGLEIYAAVGNDGDPNLLGMIPGVTAVGAHTRQNKLAPFSTPTAWVSRYAQGVYDIHSNWVGSTLKGLVIEGPTPLHVPLAMLSDSLLGQPATQHLAVPGQLPLLESKVRHPQRPLPASLSQVIFPMRLYRQWQGETPAKADNKLYVRLRPLSSEITVYAIDAQGCLYRPDDYLPPLEGTSFASPRALCDDLITPASYSMIPKQAK